MDKVSIVVATYNEQNNISTLLQSCRNQSYPDIEIIVVDSERTTDQTASISRNLKASVYVHGNERSQQRNYGIKIAKGTYVFVLDADMVLEKNVVAECVREIKKNVVGVIVPERSYGESYWAKCKALERNCYIGDPSIEAPRFFIKSIVKKLGGYDESMISGEDWDLGRRLNQLGKIGRVDSYINHNEGKLSLLKDLKKKIYYSQKANSYLRNNVFGIQDVILFIFRPAYIRNWKMILSDPFHATGLVIMKTLEFMVGGVILIQKVELWKSIFSSK